MEETIKIKMLETNEILTFKRIGKSYYLNNQYVMLCLDSLKKDSYVVISD